MEMTESFATSVNDPSATAEARRRATSLAVKLGFDEPDVGRVALVVTELATNLLKHAGGGEILVCALANGEKAGPAAGIGILALDRGPGISDLDAALRDGYSSAGSPGTGLGAIRRASSEFDVYSDRAAGTTLVAVLQPLRPPRMHGQPTLRVAGVSIAKQGEEVCGDAWALRETPDGRPLVLVVDGLGHGPGAFDAAREACRLFREDPLLGPAGLMERIHRGLRPTRGAAAAVVEIDPGRGSLVYAGVGNIAGQVLGGDRPRALVSHHGILGHEARRIQEFTYPWPEGATLVLQSDGLTSRWDLDSYRGLMRHHPAVIAGILYRDFKRPHDDITVVVARPWAT
jgi:anti-sigma regulatory factor (Ser/Thr protein kinase)